MRSHGDAVAGQLEVDVLERRLSRAVIAVAPTISADGGEACGASPLGTGLVSLRPRAK